MQKEASRNGAGPRYGMQFACYDRQEVSFSVRFGLFREETSPKSCLLMTRPSLHAPEGGGCCSETGRAMKAVIFDMDGIIVNSEPIHERAFYEVLEEIGFGRNHGMEFANYVGRSDFIMWQDFVAKHKPRQTLEELLKLKRDRVIACLQKTEPFFPGLIPLVKSLEGKYVLAVASGSERLVVEAVLALQGLGRFFPVVVTAGDVRHGKPAPDIFLHTARLLEVKPGECWVIEDSKPGVQSGLAAGMRVIAVPNSHPAEELARAHHVIGDYGEIGRLLAASK
jgi:HAD superfamily hydrolase (TIGR01509 family)